MHFIWPLNNRDFSSQNEQSVSGIWKRSRVPLWKRMKCFPSTQRRRNLKTQQSSAILDLWLSEPRLGKSRDSLVLSILLIMWIGHVRYINILAWLRGFRVKIANFSSFFCPSIPKRDLDTKKTTPNIEFWPESLGAMLEYWYIECGLLATVRRFESGRFER